MEREEADSYMKFICSIASIALLPACTGGPTASTPPPSTSDISSVPENKQDRVAFAQLHYRQALEHYQRLNFEEAGRNIQQALEARPDYPEAKNLANRIAVCLGKERPNWPPDANSTYPDIGIPTVIFRGIVVEKLPNGDMSPIGGARFHDKFGRSIRLWNIELTENDIVGNPDGTFEVRVILPIRNIGIWGLIFSPYGKVNVSVESEGYNPSVISVGKEQPYTTVILNRK
jgi:hypothetical protein